MFFLAAAMFCKLGLSLPMPYPLLPYWLYVAFSSLITDVPLRSPCLKTNRSGQVLYCWNRGLVNRGAILVCMAGRSSQSIWVCTSPLEREVDRWDGCYGRKFHFVFLVLIYLLSLVYAVFEGKDSIVCCIQEYEHLGIPTLESWRTFQGWNYSLVVL